MGFRAIITGFDLRNRRGPLPEPMQFVAGRYRPDIICSSHEIKEGGVEQVCKELHAQVTEWGAFEHRLTIQWECGGVVFADFSAAGVQYSAYPHGVRPEKYNHSSGDHSYCYGCSEPCTHGDRDLEVIE